MRGGRRGREVHCTLYISQETCTYYRKPHVHVVLHSRHIIDIIQVVTCAYCSQRFSHSPQATKKLGRKLVTLYIVQLIGRVSLPTTYNYFVAEPIKIKAPIAICSGSGQYFALCVTKLASLDYKLE